MIATPDIEQLIGAEAVDPNNDRIGKVSQVYVDAETDEPTWASVRTGLFGTSETLVPLTNASWDQETLHVGVERSRVKDAPRVDPEAEISPEEQERLYAYYGMRAFRATAADSGTAGPVGAGQVDMGAGAAISRNDPDADRVDGYDAATMSDTGYGAGAGAAGAGAPAGTGAGLAGTGVGRVPVENRAYEDRPAGPRYDRGQSVEAGEPVDGRSSTGYGEVSDEAGGPDVRGSGRTAGDGLGSGDYASTGTALENENPVAEEAAEGTGSGYGTSAVEDNSGRFLDGRERSHRVGARDEMREAGATPAGDAAAGAGMPGMAGGVAGAGSEAGSAQTGTAGMQRQAGGGMRLRRYVVHRDTIAEPLNQQDELRMQPGAASSMDDASVGVRMDDEDPSGR